MDNIKTFLIVSKNEYKHIANSVTSILWWGSILTYSFLILRKKFIGSLISISSAVWELKEVYQDYPKYVTSNMFLVLSIPPNMFYLYMHSFDIYWPPTMCKALRDCGQLYT